jgi:endonuclease/exonuclease/phosphatase (EEP) superfamily protein YafD
VYPLAGVEARLLVVNAHLVNFSGSGGEYRRQVRALEVLLGSHEGPLIVAGDFNTWSDGRLGAVAAMAGRLGLEEVVFTEGSPVVFFGRHVDHVYYRGLQVRRARVAPVASSDHRPLLVEFSLKDEGR